MKVEPTLMTVQQCASYLAVSERTVWNLLKDRTIPSIQFGRIRRIEKADVDSFIQKMKGGG